MTAGGAFAFKSEWRAHPGAVARRFRDIIRRWRTGHWRGGMAMTRHHYRLAHRRLDFDRLDRRGFDNRCVNNRCFNCGFRRRRDGHQAAHRAGKRQTDAGLDPPDDRAGCRR